MSCGSCWSTTFCQTRSLSQWRSLTTVVLTADVYCHFFVHTQCIRILMTCGVTGIRVGFKCVVEHSNSGKKVSIRFYSIRQSDKFAAVHWYSNSKLGVIFIICIAWLFCRCSTQYSFQLRAMWCILIKKSLYLMCLCYLFSAKTAWQLVNRKADFYKTNQDSLIQRTDSNGSKEYNMTYTLFFIADYQFQKVFYMFP